MALEHGTERDAAFAVIQQALETFNAEIGRARAGQTRSEETLASVEYELNQLRKLIAENALPQTGAKAATRPLSDADVATRDAGAGRVRRSAGRAA